MMNTITMPVPRIGETCDSIAESSSEYLSSAVPQRHKPFCPQMGDEIMYFRKGYVTVHNCIWY